MTTTELYSCIRVPAVFPVENRPIYVTPIADMTAKKKDESFPKMAHALLKLARKYPDDRVLIHTVSYDLASYLTRALTSQLGPTHKRVMTYATGGERDRIIERYRATEGAVLIAPSLERGVDFKGDDCRVVAIAKVPYPNLGDKQVAARMHSRGGQLWYGVQTARSLVQMSGRGVRSADDRCDTFILDTQFISNFYKRSKALLPSWWLESLDMSARFVSEFSAP